MGKSLFSKNSFTTFKHSWNRVPNILLSTISLIVEVFRQGSSLNRRCSSRPQGDQGNITLYWYSWRDAIRLGFLQCSVMRGSTPFSCWLVCVNVVCIVLFCVKSRNYLIRTKIDHIWKILITWKIICRFQSLINTRSIDLCFTEIIVKEVVKKKSGKKKKKSFIPILRSHIILKSTASDKEVG